MLISKSSKTTIYVKSKQYILYTKKMISEIQDDL